LLNSTSSLWPNGLANDSGLVGRNLMRHFTDLYAVFLPGTDTSFDNRRKEIAFNDFYHVQGMKLGSVQSFGRLPPSSILADSLHDDLRESWAAWLSPMFTLVKPVIGGILRRLVDRTFVLASVVEDLPYTDNRVDLVCGPDRQGGVRLAINYQIRPYDASRIRALRLRMKQALKPFRYRLIKQAENNQRIAHACGTCRFGVDPRESVLNRENRAHDIANLFVVDSSFCPSSAGTNPALTIAANALRVAATIHANRA
jgi:choline dehydrogenase-like flavoprotein